MIGKVLFWIFVAVVAVLFLRLKNMPIWLRVGFAVAIPFFLLGIILLLSWVFAFVLLVLFVLFILALFFGLKSKMYSFGRKKR